MKKSITFLLMWLGTAISMLPQTMVWEKNIGEKLMPMSKAITISNGYTIIFITGADDTKIMALENDEIIWEKNINAIVYDICENQDGFCITIEDSVRAYNLHGGVIYSYKVPTAIPYYNMLRITEFEGGYIVIDGGNHSEKKVVAIYNINHDLIKSWFIDKGEHPDDITVTNNNLIIASWGYNSGGTNVHSQISAYDFNGNRLWNDSIPDADRPRVASENGNVYMTASVYYQIDSILGIRNGWLVKKYNSNGQIMWERIWHGDRNYNTNLVYDIQAIPYENGGCMIAGATTRPDIQDEYQGTIKAFTATGDTAWKIIYDNEAYRYSYFGATHWDQNKYLLGLHCFVSRFYIEPNQNKLIKYSIPGITQVLPEANTGTPSNFVLCQNYPNPFNPSTTISYSIAEQSFVSIKVYDMLGQEVATLVNKELNAGSYDINFNASSLASGTYIYKLKTGNFNSIKKMILLK